MPKLDALTLKQLRALGAVSRLGSITAAAETLGLTPPAVHTQLRGLETALGCKVLASSGAGGAVLTPEGDAVLRANAQIENALAACVERVRALRSGMAGVVVLGVVSTGKYFAPRLVARLHAVFPDIELILKVGNRGHIIDDLQHGSIELAIMGRPPRSPPVIAHVLGPHPHVLIAPPDHRLAGKARIEVAELLAETFIAREDGSGTRILMTRYLDRLGEGAPYRQIEMGSNETIKQAVMAGLGIAMISQHTVSDEIRTGRLVTLPADGLPIERRWYLLHREDLTLSPTLENICNFVLSLNGDYLPRL